MEGLEDAASDSPFAAVRTPLPLTERSKTHASTQNPSKTCETLRRGCLQDYSCCTRI